MTDTAAAAETDVNVDQSLKEAYFTASQGQLIWARFKKQRAAMVAQQKSKLASASAELKIKQQEVRRLERLRENSSAAFRQALYDDKLLQVAMLEGDYSEAQARLKQATAELRLAELNLKYTKIRAPYAGVVSLRHTEIGSFLKVGEGVVTLISDQSLEIEADVPSSRMAGLTKNRRIEVDVDGKKLAALVRAIVPEENPQTRTRAVRFSPEFATGNTDFAANQSVTLQIPIASDQAVVSVHKDAVLNRRGEDMVFLVAEGKAKPQSVELGDAVGERFIVRGGLRPGDIVVVRGNERLLPGQPVKF